MNEYEINPPELLDIARSGFARGAERPARIAVLGAGIAGLCAALELRNAGHKVMVLEGQNRVGGRVLTLREGFSEGVYAEAGAMRIPARHKLVLSYVERYGLRLRPFRSENPDAWAYFHHERHRLRKAIDDHHNFGFELTELERNIPFQTRLAHTLEPALQSIAAGDTEDWLALQRHLQSISLRDYLNQLGWSDGAVEKYGLFAGFETLLHASACEFIREFAADLRSATYAIDGGMDLLPRAIAQDLKGSIRYGQVITALDQDANGVSIHVRTQGGPEVVQADYALCTLPLSVMRHIEILQPFSTGKQRAIRNIHYEAATKIFFECSRRFWERDDGIYGGASVTDLAIRNIYYPEQNRILDRGVLLASYSHGQDAHRWGSLSEHERLVQALENVAEIHPQILNHVEGGQSVIWNQDEFAGGAYAFFQPHQEAQLHHHILSPEGRYHFAGEHASLQHRWLQGAVESALRVAGDIHALTFASSPVRLDTREQSELEINWYQDEPSLRRFGQDFGDIVHRIPHAVVKPATTGEVVRAIKYAAEHDLKVVARGIGHSAGGQSQVEGGLVVDMTSMNTIHNIDPAKGSFEADAGVTWQALLDAMLPLGLAPAVVTDWLQLTLGGTVSAGGVGAQSFCRGIQADLVESLEVVTALGEVLMCSAKENVELFNCARAGLGQFGIITRVKMRLEAAPENLTLDHLVYDNLQDFLNDTRTLSGQEGVHGLLAHALPNEADAIARATGCEEAVHAHPTQAVWLYDLEVLRYHKEGVPAPLPPLSSIAKFSTSKVWRFADFTRRVPPIIERDAIAGAAPHPELAMFVPDSEADAFIGQVMAKMPVADMGGGPVLIIPLCADNVSAPAFRMPDGARCWLFGLLRAAVADDVARLQAINAELYQQGSALGALRYPCDSLQQPSDKASWRKHYGTAWSLVEKVRDEVDPLRQLGPNQHVD